MKARKSTGRTIASLATAPGRAAIAVIRISGPGTREAIAKLGVTQPKARKAGLTRLCDPSTGEEIDQGLVLWFPAPASFTGEDAAELQVHGSRAVVAALLRALTEGCGVEPAQPGEFTRRAFDNGKLDLAQAEGLADLVAAETDAQRKQAGRQLAGALGAQAEQWRARLIEASAFLEAGIDFPDEDLPTDIFRRAAPLVRSLVEEIGRVLQDGRAGERLREGLSIAIVGPPNAGKSTLMNALARREVAITSEHAGTTRDAIEVALDLGGYPAVLIDTAGLRDSDDPVEQEGVRRARARAESADLRVVVWEAAKGPPDWEALGLEPRSADILALSKIDMDGKAGDRGDWSGDLAPISARTGAGMDRLIELIATRASELLTAEQAPLITRARHRHELSRALAALKEALSVDPEYAELASEELRVAALALGRISGRIDVEDILDVVFGEFCIGK